MASNRNKKPLYESLGGSMGSLMNEGKPANIKTGKPIDIGKQTSQSSGERSNKKLFLYLTGLIAVVFLSAFIAFSLIDMKSSGQTEQPAGETYQAEGQKESPTSTKNESNSESLLDKEQENSYNSPSGSEKPAEKEVSQEGSNRIVVASYGSRRDLQPVMKYYEANGIQLKIVEIGSRYFLVTARKFERFSEGSRGRQYLEQIKEIGLGYNAPKGYERFSSTPFQDAYGRKMN
ncbi:hypothetical protein L21SP3_00260 [Sedimentisphaera cyanobacteriorum]|uniref:Sporulation related domain protein n=1 Tax=Sedimentisphaera cyanobacteriorum TaxID=1940790 RepID=A0A1Q2HLM8_9BACT|nr:hypothetical protein [Sedimentisphaera cyanobacteriorum]AQQ08479.1 hypothetical protein L21SP3_00260 [Sedimentisphaera cyanobacteriorum]